MGAARRVLSSQAKTCFGPSLQVFPSDPSIFGTFQRSWHSANKEFDSGSSQRHYIKSTTTTLGQRSRAFSSGECLLWTSASSVLPGATNATNTRGFASIPWFGASGSPTSKSPPAADSAVDPAGASNGDSVSPPAGGALSVDGGEGAAGHVAFASAVVDAVGGAEAAAQAVAIGNSWWLTGLLIKGMCRTTEFLEIPWSATIPGVTLGARAAIFPLMVWMEKTKVTMQAIQPEVERLKQKYPGLYQGDRAAQQAFARETSELFARHNTSPTAPLMMLPISLSQVFLFGTFFFSLQNLFAAKLPSLVSGGLPWCPDLTAPDPTFVLPVVTAGLTLVSVELGATDMGTSSSSGLMKHFMRAAAGLFLVMGSYFPSGMFLYFATTNSFTLAQLAVLRSPAFRTAVGLPKLGPKSSATAQTESLSDMYKRFFKQLEDAQKPEGEGDGEVKTYPIRRSRRRKTR